MEKVLEAAKVPKLKEYEARKAAAATKSSDKTHPAPLDSLLIDTIYGLLSKRRSTEPESWKQATHVLFALAQG